MTTLVERAQSGRNIRRAAPPLVILEGIALLLAAPFLLFPERSPLLTAATAALLAVLWLISLTFAPFPPTPFNLVLLLWCFVLLVGVVVSADQPETLPKAMGLILGLAVWRFAALAIFTRRHAAAAVALWLLMALGFTLVAFLNLQEMPKIPALVALNPVRGLSLPGMGTIVVHPNQMAGLICLYLPLLISLAVAPPERLATPWWRAMLGVLVLLVGAILVLSQSRGGWVAFLSGLFALLVLWSAALPPSRKRRAVRTITLALIVAGLAAVLWIGPAAIRDLWMNPPEQTVIGTLSTLEYRKELWTWSISAIGDFPFTGVGLGAFREVAFRLYPLSLSQEFDIGHAHNIFFQTALDTGLPGLAIYLAILMVAAAAAWRIARRDAGLRTVSLGLLAGLVALHVFGLADALALGSKPGLLFWSALGLLAAMNKEGLTS